MSTKNDFIGKLPVFVSPTTVEFYTNDLNSHKQILTLFNPYEFVIKFKILCNSPRKYTIPDPEGLIRPKCCVDLVIRHMDVSAMNENQTDKLRIQIYNQNDNILIGKKDIPLTLLSSSSQSILNDEQSMKSNNNVNNLNSFFLRSNDTSLKNQASIAINAQQQNQEHESVNFIVLFVGLVCIVLLFFPTCNINDAPLDDSSIPKYLHLKFELKLFIAYILGMVTMVILRY